MKLQTKLSASIVAASFSALLFMSSCSKEDALTPQPESAGLKDDANMRGGATTGLTGSTGLTPSTLLHIYPTTIDQPWKGSFPIGWYGIYGEYGTSSTQYLGNKQGRWAVELPQPQAGVETFVTGKTTKYYSGNVGTLLKNLQRNHKYRLTYYVSTSSVQTSDLPSSLGIGSPTTVGVKVWVTTKETNPQLAGYGKTPYNWTKTISFAGKANQWIKETIEFNALSETSLNIYGYHPNGEEKDTYYNVSVGKYSVEDLGQVPVVNPGWTH